jgi:RimJ/RimL family protein N-acetyltransferase
MIEISKGDITLRRFRFSDCERLVELANNPKVSENLRDGFPHPYTLQDAKVFIKSHLEDTHSAVFAIEFKGQYVGNIGLHAQTDVYRKSFELGYFLGESYWGQGIMTKAVQLMIEHGFLNLDVERIFSSVFGFNKASQRVLEKCNFKMEGIARQAIYKKNTFFDEYLYGMTRNDWQKQRVG